MGYTRATIKGISWVSGVRIFTRMIAFLKTLLLARLLTPFQFGVFDITTIVLSLSELITETGINVFLVQERKDISVYINTAWVVSIIRGGVISTVIFISAPFISHFFNSKDSYFLILAISLVPLLRGFINPSVIAFQKDLKFHREFFYRASVFLVEACSSIVFVVFYNNPISLVCGLITGAFYEVCISFIFISPRPRFIVKKDHFTHILRQGSWVTVAGISNYLYHNVDNLVIGKMLGLSSLGVYDMAYNLAMVPITEITDVVSKVTFPVFVKIGGEKNRLLKAYLKTVFLIVGVCIPIGLLFFIFPDIIIRLLLGEKWLSAIPIFRVLAIFGVIRAILISPSPVFMAIKKQKYSAYISLTSFISLGVIIIPFILGYGLLGATYAVLLSTVLEIPYVLFLIYKVFK